MATPPKVPPPLSEEELQDLRTSLTKDRASRAESAVALKIAGANYTQIAKALDYAHPALARQAVEQALSTSVHEEDRKAQRLLSSARIEALLRSVWPRANDSRDPDHLGYMRGALALIDRHAKLWGLDAPIEIVSYTPTQVEYQAALDSIVQQFVRDLPQEADIIGEVLDDESA